MTERFIVPVHANYLTDLLPVMLLANGRSQPEALTSGNQPRVRRQRGRP